jgi:hypothetical protein
MSEHTTKPNPIIGQVSEPLTMDDLPPPNIRRWITRRKAEVVTAVRTGLLSLDDACVRYGITSEEFLSWQRLLDEHGLRGLRTTRLQKYRFSTKGEGMTDTESADMGAAGYPPINSHPCRGKEWTGTVKILNRWTRSNRLCSTAG